LSVACGFVAAVAAVVADGSVVAAPVPDPLGDPVLAGGDVVVVPPEDGDAVVGVGVLAVGVGVGVLAAGVGAGVLVGAVVTI
jgi:hypothetical protein